MESLAEGVASGTSPCGLRVAMPAKRLEHTREGSWLTGSLMGWRASKPIAGGTGATAAVDKDHDAVRRAELTHWLAGGRAGGGREGSLHAWEPRLEAIQ